MKEEGVMDLLCLAFVVGFCGAAGGFVNVFIGDNGLHLPRVDHGVLLPGFLGNVFIGTLAALDLFARAGLDVAVLEVGLGGRLDAVNIVDADVAIVTTVDLDHMDWLGPDRDSIGREKAGIARAGRPMIVGVTK